MVMREAFLPEMGKGTCNGVCLARFQTILTSQGSPRLPKAPLESSELSSASYVSRGLSRGFSGLPKSFQGSSELFRTPQSSQDSPELSGLPRALQGSPELFRAPKSFSGLFKKTYGLEIKG